MEPVDLKAKDQYLQQDRSVSIKNELEKQQKLKDSGLNGVEVRQTVKSLGMWMKLEIFLFRYSAEHLSGLTK